MDAARLTVFDAEPSPAAARSARREPGREIGRDAGRDAATPQTARAARPRSDEEVAREGSETPAAAPESFDAVFAAAPGQSPVVDAEGGALPGHARRAHGVGAPETALSKGAAWPGLATTSPQAVPTPSAAVPETADRAGAASPAAPAAGAVDAEGPSAGWTGLQPEGTRVARSSQPVGDAKTLPAAAADAAAPVAAPPAVGAAREAPVASSPTGDAAGQARAAAVAPNPRGDAAGQATAAAVAPRAPAAQHALPQTGPRDGPMTGSIPPAAAQDHQTAEAASLDAFGPLTMRAATAPASRVAPPDAAQRLGASGGGAAPQGARDDDEFAARGPASDAVAGRAPLSSAAAAAPAVAVPAAAQARIAEGPAPSRTTRTDGAAPTPVSDGADGLPDRAAGPTVAAAASGPAAGAPRHAGAAAPFSRAASAPADAPTRALVAAGAKPGAAPGPASAAAIAWDPRRSLGAAPAAQGDVAAPATQAQPGAAAGLADLALAEAALGAAPASVAARMDAPGPSPIALAGPPQAQLRTMARAVAQARDGDRVELRLDPPELGRVLIDIRIENGVLSADVSAERPETLELMRRHAETLQRELAAAGFERADLDFSGRRRAATAVAPDGAAPPVDPPAEPAPTRAARVAGDRLDIRL